MRDLLVIQAVLELMRDANFSEIQKKAIMILVKEVENNECSTGGIFS